ncbi:MAG: regulatory protein RecX [Thermoleophilia bacterium]
MSESDTHVVSALRATKRGRIGLHIDGEFVCTIGETLVARHHLFAGKIIDEDLLVQLRDEALSDKALADAYRLLGQRARSRHELAERLSQKGYEVLLVSRVLESLAASGLIDDGAFAQAFAADKRRFGSWGDERIARELNRLGVPAEFIATAIGPSDATRDLERAAAALRKYGAPRGERDADMRRAVAVLRRRGFSASTSYRAMRLWLDDPSIDEGQAGEDATE